MTARRRPARVRGPVLHLLLWLTGLVALAQTQGFVHAIVHAQHGHAAHASATIRAPASGVPSRAGDAPAAAGWLAHLFPGHDDAATCQLFDHACLGDGPRGVAAPAIPCFGTAIFAPVFEAAAPPLATTLAEARGPPPVP